MSEKFTKEPWEISDMSCHDAMDNFTVCFHIGVSSTGEMIADCQSDNKADYERVRANAYLMKAAPEMYEFVKMFTSTAGQILLSHADNGKEIYNEAVRILKKARGEE